MSIYGLGEMGINWAENIPQNAQNALLSSTMKNVKEAIKLESNNINIKIKNIDTEINEDMNNKMKKKVIPSVGSNSNSNSNFDVHDEIDKNRTGMTIQSISNILYGFSSMKLMWFDLTTELKNEIISLLLLLLRNSLHQKPNLQIIPKFIEKKEIDDNIWKNKNKNIGHENNFKNGHNENNDNSYSNDKSNNDNNSDNKNNKNNENSDDDKKINPNLSIAIFDVITSREFRFLLNSLSIIKFDFSDLNPSTPDQLPIYSPSPSSSSSLSISISQLNKLKLKETLLTLFVQLSSHDDIEMENKNILFEDESRSEERKEMENINEIIDNEENYRTINNKLFHRMMTVKDFFVCVQSLGEKREEKK